MATDNQKGPRLQGPVKVKGSVKGSVFPCEYWWRNMRPGMKRVTASKVDALIEILEFELDRPRRTDILAALGTSAATISRCRYRGDPISHRWLFRAAVYSGIPYDALCGAVGEEEIVSPHPKAWKEVKK